MLLSIDLFAISKASELKHKIVGVIVMSIQKSDLYRTNIEKIEDITELLQNIAHKNDPEEVDEFLTSVKLSILEYMVDKYRNFLEQESIKISKMQYGQAKIDDELYEELDEEWDEDELDEELDEEWDEEELEEDWEAELIKLMLTEKIKENRDEGLKREIKLIATPIIDSNSFIDYLNTVVEINVENIFFNLNEANKKNIGYLVHYLQNITEEQFEELKEILTEEDLNLIEKGLTELYFIHCQY